MSAEKALVINHAQPAATATFLPCSPVLTSHQSGWKNIYLAHYQLPVWETPEVASPQHTIVMASWQQSTAVEILAEDRLHLIHGHKDRIGGIDILPAYVSTRCNWNQRVEFTHFYLEPTFISHAAYESVNPDRVELKLTLQQPDLLIWQIGLTLKNALETNPDRSCFYAESMATALAAHLLQFYATRKQILRKNSDGLPKSKLDLATEYINTYLDRDISLTALAVELDLSQYYFCKLFKQSIGMTPHAYLIQQRLERAKQLLKYSKGTMLDIALQCGFANPSHFAKYFRQKFGVSPKEFRMML
jgi:AraC family transcriptional regulator